MMRDTYPRLLLNSESEVNRVEVGRGRPGGK